MVRVHVDPAPPSSPEQYSYVPVTMVTPLSYATQVKTSKE